MLQNNKEEYQIKTKLVPKAQQIFQQWAKLFARLFAKFISTSYLGCLETF
jgi:hypothetical protein